MYLQIAQPVTGEPTEADDCIIKLVNATTNTGVILQVYCEAGEKAGDRIFIFKAVQYEAGVVKEERVAILDSIQTIFHEKYNSDVEELLIYLNHALALSQFRDSSGGSNKAAIEGRAKALSNSRRGTPSLDAPTDDTPKAPRIGTGRGTTPSTVDPAATPSVVDKFAAEVEADESGDGGYL